MIEFAPLQSISSYIPNPCKSIAIIADDQVAALYGKMLQRSLKLPSRLFTFPSGEQNKNRRTKESIEDAMFCSGIDRHSIVIALGGGVALDLAGYIAATYMRGIPFISIPTTLLAMTDAAIGGKNGVNTEHGKNLIGTFYEPLHILIDLDCLHTLDRNEVRSGFAEIIKHALIADCSLLDFLESHVEALLNLEKTALLPALERSIVIKQMIIADDFHDRGRRTLLNFGHTVGHALELLSGYSLLHGDAVAKGMAYELFLSKYVRGFHQEEIDRSIALLTRFGFSLSLDGIDVDALIAAMRADKKKAGQTLRFALLARSGSFPPEPYCCEVEEALLRTAFLEMKRSIELLHSRQL